MRRIDPALVVLLAGVSAALHVGKLPPAIPVLRDALGVTLVQAGFLLSLVQLAGMTLGIAAGAAADGIGPRRTMIAGLAILSAAGWMGGWATSATALLALRGVEGLGFLLATLPAPGLLRRVAMVSGAGTSRVMGMWGAYMPIGTATALLLGPAILAAAGWPFWWWLLASVSAGMAIWLWKAVPAQLDAVPRQAQPETLGRRLDRTLRAPGPWLAALSFAVYSGQWLAVVGFLPSIYAQAGWGAGAAAAATALAAGINLVGNIASGRLLHRGVPPRQLLQGGFLAMAVGAIVAFTPFSTVAPAWDAALRYGGVLLFSMLGGLVPGTLFSLSVHLAPDERSLSTTVGWMQQWSSLGQFAGPPFVAWIAARNGTWDGMGWVTAGFAVAGALLAVRIAALLQPRTQPAT